jgi:hypothetical protein
MRPWSLRWWFENRETGAITIAQFPNPPLWIALAAWVVVRIADGVVGTIAQTVLYLSVLWWAGDEIVRGVNPWRRVLGIGGVIWVVVRVLG